MIPRAEAILATRRQGREIGARHRRRETQTPRIDDEHERFSFERLPVIVSIKETKVNLYLTTRRPQLKP